MKGNVHRVWSIVILVAVLCIQHKVYFSGKENLDLAMQVPAMPYSITDVCERPSHSLGALYYRQ